MELIQFPVRRELARYVKAIWRFDATGGLPSADSKIVVPNGAAKLIFTIENTLICEGAGIIDARPEATATFVGVWDQASRISSHEGTTRTLGVEFHPGGVARLFGCRMSETTNRLVEVDALLGAEGKRLAARIWDEEGVGLAKAAKRQADVVQDFLNARLRRFAGDLRVLDWILSEIQSREGVVSIEHLSQKSGYSRRYIAELFREHVGVPPKGLASIARFQHFYRRWASDATEDFYQDMFYEFYHDQSHFIREFRRFSGESPQRYARQMNEFGRIFYRPSER